jgi:putative heme-binding domain-containing protein
VAFTLGESGDPRAIDALAAIAARDIDEPWIRTAVLSSCATRAEALAAALTKSEAFLAKDASTAWLEPLATIVGARKQNAEVSRLLETAAAVPHDSRALTAVVLGLGAGLQRSGSSLDAIRSGISTGAAELLDELTRVAVRTAGATDGPMSARADAVRLLGYCGGQTTIDTLAALLDPREDESLRLASVRALARCRDAKVADHLVAAWRQATPSVQEEILAVLASRDAWVGALLWACQRGEIPPGHVPAAIRTTLLSSGDSVAKATAKQLFGATSARAEVIARYQPALSLAGDARRGEQVYERECMACHNLGERGYAVGPNLALVRNRTPAAMLEAILDPNRDVQPNYVSYVVVDDSGRTTTGLIQAETAGSVTLARDKGVTETIQKQNIEQIRSTGASLMPEGLERTVDAQQMADLLAFLKEVQYDIGTLPDFAKPEK